jgi:hypothetical protein
VRREEGCRSPGPGYSAPGQDNYLNPRFHRSTFLPSTEIAEPFLPSRGVLKVAFPPISSFSFSIQKAQVIRRSGCLVRTDGWFHQSSNRERELTSCTTSGRYCRSWRACSCFRISPGTIEASIVVVHDCALTGATAAISIVRRRPASTRENGAS